MVVKRGRVSNDRRFTFLPRGHRAMKATHKNRSRIVLDREVVELVAWKSILLKLENVLGRSRGKLGRHILGRVLVLGRVVHLCEHLRKGSGRGEIIRARHVRRRTRFGKRRALRTVFVRRGEQQFCQVLLSHYIQLGILAAEIAVVVHVFSNVRCARGNCSWLFRAGCRRRVPKLQVARQARRDVWIRRHQLVHLMPKWCYTIWNMVLVGRLGHLVQQGAGGAKHGHGRSKQTGGPLPP